MTIANPAIPGKLSQFIAKPSPEEKILRFVVAQRIAHWLWSIPFVLLLITGLAVLIGAPDGVLRTGGLVHRAMAVILTMAPIFYAVTHPQGLGQLIKDSFTYGKDDVQWFLKAPYYFLGHAEQMPPQGRLNAGEKVHHALTILGLLAIGGSGYVLWFAKGQNPELFLAAGMIHDLSMALLTVLFLGHLYFTFVYDDLMAMIDGTVTRRYAEMEHSKGLATLDTAKVKPAATKR